MDFIQNINDILTGSLGPFGPLIAVGVIGLVMILVTVPLLLNQPEDPLKKLQRSNSEEKKGKPKKERLRQAGRNEQLDRFATFLEPQDKEELSSLQLKLRQAGYMSAAGARAKARLSTGLAFAATSVLANHRGRR